jgi:hypothetical protein
LLAVAIALAGWVYDIGRRFAGFDKNTADQELSRLRDRVEVLETEAGQLRGIGNGSEASLQIERTSLQKLSEQVKRLEAENGHLREDLAAFESLAADDEKNEGIRISRIQVEPDPATAGAYRYRLLLTAPVSRPDRGFKGKLQLVGMIQQGAKATMLNISNTAEFDQQKLVVDFKYFRRIEGGFMLPANAVLKKLEVRLMQGATVVTSQQVTL